MAESAPGETRVAATPKTVEQLLALGYQVLVERGAGAQAAFTDQAFTASGAWFRTRPRSGTRTWCSR